DDADRMALHVEDQDGADPVCGDQLRDAVELFAGYGRDDGSTLAFQNGSDSHTTLLSAARSRNGVASAPVGQHRLLGHNSMPLPRWIQTPSVGRMFPPPMEAEDRVMDEVVNFTRMEDGTYDEYQLLMRKYEPLVRNLPNEVISSLKMLAGDTMGYKIDRYQHSLQTASRAFRDGADEETVVCALLHDIGDTLAPENHAQLGA